MTIYCYGNRLVMVLKTEDHYQIDEAFQQYLNYDPLALRGRRKWTFTKWACPERRRGKNGYPWNPVSTYPTMRED